MTSIINATVKATVPGREAQDLRDAVADALRQARDVRDLLSQTIIPELEPRRRAAAEDLARRLAQATFFDEVTLRDIERFQWVLEREIDAGTHVGWEADEHHVCGGHEQVELDARARGLVPARACLERLRASIATAMDLARAQALAQELTSE